MKIPPYGLREQEQFGTRLFSVGDSVPKPLGFTALPPEWLFSLGRLAPPRHSGRRVGARVASLRSPILRPGEASINRVGRRMMTQRKKLLPKVSPVR